MTCAAPSAPSVLTSDDVYEQHDALGPLVARLPELDLGPARRKALSGYLFLEGPGLVLCVAAALRTAPELFPQGAARAISLLARLRRAQALRTLERLLLTAARRAGELALHDQAGAVRDALAVLEGARRQAADPDGRRRLRLLAPALRLLDRRRRRAREGLVRARKQRAGTAQRGQGEMPATGPAPGLPILRDGVAYPDAHGHGHGL